MAERPVLRMLLLLGALLCGPSYAEKADRNKPTNIEADRMSSDEARRLSIFEGNVLLTNGTMMVRAERIVVRQDADGFRHATAYGRPVQFRQKSDAKDGREGLWTEGEAMRIEIDARNERVELFERARVSRGQDMVNGEYIFVDQRTEFFSVSAAKGATADDPAGRVKAVIQPKAAPDAK